VKLLLCLSHLVPVYDAAPFRSTANSQKLHPNGQRRIPVRAVAEVHGHVCEIPLEAYGPHVRRGSMVTPEDVERASDKWDAMGIAHDIDTQWGSIPHGGAYKESDFFYGDDPFDF
jgi:hypothetical protein